MLFPGYTAQASYGFKLASLNQAYLFSTRVFRNSKTTTIVNIQLLRYILPTTTIFQTRIILPLSLNSQLSFRHALQ